MNGIRRHWPLLTGLGLLGLFLGVHYLGWWPGMGMAWGGHPGPRWGHGWWPMGFMGLPMLLFWVLVAMAVWALVSSLAGGRRDEQAPERPRAALEILESRYAKGELSREEYLAMRGDIQGG